MTILTERQRKIIYILANSNLKEPITMDYIAKTLNLSRRTIARDFKKIQSWFKENDFKFSIKKGIGLILNESKETKLYLIELLNFDVKKNYLNVERKILILSNLLVSNTPIKSAYFLKAFDISETTFNSDFNSLSNWLSSFNVKILKKQGIGLYLSGKEENMRICYINSIYEYYKSQDFIDILKNLNNNIIGDNVIIIMLKLINIELLISIINIVDSNIKFFNLVLSDDSYVEFILLLAICIKRISQNNTVKQIENDDLKSFEEFNIIKNICLDIENNLNIVIDDKEQLFILNHFKSLKQIKNFNSLDMEIIKVTKTLIKNVEYDLSIDLAKDTIFFNDLLNHLDSSIHRIKMNMKIRNPFLEDVKNEYSYMYELIKTHTHFLKALFDIYTFPEEEIAYITMHFIVAYERALYKETTINVILSCPTGVATSKVLFKDITQRFPNINVVDILPSIKLNNYILKENNIDLVISTIDVNIDIPFFKIDSIFDYEIEKKLKKIIFNISKQKLNNKQKETSIEVKKGVETNSLFNILNISNDILSIIENFEFIDNANFFSFETTLEYICSLVLNNNNLKHILKQELETRINLNFPYFEDIDIFLLHCKSITVNRSIIKVLNLKNNICHKDKFFKNILIMILPKNCNDIHRELLSDITSNLLNNSLYLNKLKFSNKETMLEILKNIMIDFYKNKLNKI